MLKSKKIIYGLMVTIFLLIECSTNNTYAVNQSTQGEESNNTSSNDVQNAETDSTSKSSASWVLSIESGGLRAHNPEKHKGNDDIEPLSKRTPVVENNNEQIYRSPTRSNDTRLFGKEMCCAKTPILNDNDEKETCCVIPSSGNDGEKEKQTFKKNRDEAQKVFETYLHCYMYKFKEYINSSDDYKREIANLKYKEGEINLDLDLRKYLGKKINEFYNEFNKNSDMKVRYDGCDCILTKEEIDRISIKEVIIPEETTELSNYIKTKCQRLKPNARRYVNMDILMILKRDKLLGYVPIEVKSVTDHCKGQKKEYTIAGSSLNQIIPNGWLIFVKHPQDKKDFKKVEVAVSKYGLTMKNVTPVVKFNPSVSFKLADKVWEIKDDKIILNDQVKKSSTSDILGSSNIKLCSIIKNFLENCTENGSECTSTLENYYFTQVSSSLSLGTGCSPIAKVSSPGKDESNLKSFIKKVLSGALKELAQYKEDDIMKILSNFRSSSSQFD